MDEVLEVQADVRVNDEAKVVGEVVVPLLPLVQQAYPPAEVEVDKTTANVISQEGQYQIRMYLGRYSELGSDGERRYYIENFIQRTCGWEESLPSGNGHRYQGKFAKRLAKAYADDGVKLGKETIAKVGELASRFSVKKNLFLDFTNCFDWDDGDFGDSRSCYWGEREQARFILMAHGVWAVRIYRQQKNDGNISDLDGYGRAWAVVDKTAPGDLLIFNLYGATNTEFRTVIEHWLEKETGATYKGNTVEVSVGADEPLYMNHDAILFSTHPPAWNRDNRDYTNLNRLIGYAGGFFNDEWYGLIPGFRPDYKWFYDEVEEEDEPEDEEEPEEDGELDWSYPAGNN